ncbi:MAG: exopolysaccharide biosynthesis protein [Proteobacteria bacterium]|nr:exopolysaccharide biosynthesis protein [Pseudomonadota bacterium]
MTQQHALGDVLDTLVRKTDGQVSLDQVLEAIGSRGFGPMVATVGFIAVAPTGAIPGVPSTCAVIILLLSVQIFLPRRHPWLPAPLRRISIPHARLRKAVEKAEPVTHRIDRWFGRRLTALSGKAMEPLVASVCIVMALTMPPLELVPFAAAAPGRAITVLGIALTARDGVMTLVGLGLCVGALALAGWYLL